ncbi:MAG: hypothetical protein J6T38_04440 [Bacteroidaceae bacterium]|nr:hypothetical protein [Bacteroidaceae bacterium]
MKKKYMKPAMVIEDLVLPVMLEFLSADTQEFGGGTGGTSTEGTGDGTIPFVVNAKEWDFDFFDTDALLF